MQMAFCADVHTDLQKASTQLRAMQGKDGNTIFEYLVHDDGLQWVHWRDRVPAWTYPTSGAARFSQLIIPTLDSVRYEHLLSLVHSVKKVRNPAAQLQMVTLLSMLEPLLMHVAHATRGFAVLRPDQR